MVKGSDFNADSYKGDANPFPDTAAFEGGWAEGYINACAQLGVVKGYGDGTFQPGNPVTAAEALTMVLNALKIDAGAGEWPTTVMNKAAELRKSGALTAEDYNAIVSEWVRSEVKAYTDKDKGNLRGTAIRDYSDIVFNLSTWKDNGYLTDNEYNEHVASLINESNMTLLNTSVGTAIGAGNVSDMHLAGSAIVLGPGVLLNAFGFDRDTNNAIDELDKSGTLKTVNINGLLTPGQAIGQQAGYWLSGGPIGAVFNPGGSIAAQQTGATVGGSLDAMSTARVTEYNGKLYMNIVPEIFDTMKEYIPNDSKLGFIKDYPDGLWIEVSPENIHSLGDFVINNESQKQGTYDMIAAMIRQGNIVDDKDIIENAKQYGDNIRNGNVRN
jgi:hypothetical protein